MHLLSPYLIIVYFLMGLLCAFLAKKQNRNPYIWFVLGVLFGVLALLLLYIFYILSFPKKSLPKKPPVAIEDSKLWYYLEKQKQFGPVSLHKLYTLLKEGKISESSYVWNETLESWKILKETQEFSLLNERSPS